MLVFILLIQLLYFILTYLETEMATHSCILAWRIPWAKGLAGYSPWGCKESDVTEQPSLSYSLIYNMELHFSPDFSKVNKQNCSRKYIYILWACPTNTVCFFFLVPSLECPLIDWLKSLSHVRLFATPLTVAYQAPLSMGFSRQ